MISKTYNLNIKELKDLWNSRSNLMSQPMELEPPIQQIKYSSPSSPSSTKSTKSTKSKCSYKFTKGKQQGEVCSSNAKENSQYCSKHMKFEDSGQKELKYNPIPAPTEKSVDRLVRLNKELNKWWHVESKLVFKSNKEKIVVGIYKNDIYTDLCEDDIEECNKYGFKYEIKQSDILQPKKIEPLVKKTEQKIIEKKNIGSITQQINTHAKNVEDVINDMLENTNLDSDNDTDEIEEEEIELDEEY